METDSNEYFNSIVEDINNVLGYCGTKVGVFYSEVVDYIDKFYYNFKLVFELDPIEIKKIRKGSFQKGKNHYSRLIDSSKIDEFVFHEARPKEEKGALVDDVLEE
jgi:hypothetical protein